jgi:UDP-glucose 4-epimerase
MDLRDPEKKEEGIHYMNGDFFDDIYLKQIIEDKDIIYHAISTVQPGNSNEKYMSGYSRDMVETVRLCSYLLGSKKRMIFLSSGGTVYGPQEVQPIREAVCAQPINHYGNVKLCIENAIRVFNLQMHTKMLIARISNPYGPGQDFQKGVGFVDATIKKALHHETLQIWGDGNIVRDYIYIDDVCEMLYQLSLYNGEEEVFNLGSGVGTSQNQVVQLVKKIAGDFHVEYTQGRSVDVKKIVLDNTKIRSIYQKELISLEEGIQSYFTGLQSSEN